MKLIYKVFVIIVSLFFAGVCHATDFTVGVEDIPYYPYYTINAKGEYVGFAREVLDLFSTAKGIHLIYEVRTPKKLRDGFDLEQEFDFKFPDDISWHEKQAKKNIHLSLPMCSYTDGVIVLAKNKDKPQDFFKLLGIGTIHGFTPIGLEGVKSEKSTNIEALIKKVKYERIAGAYLNVTVALSRINSNDSLKGQFLYLDRLPHYKGNYRLSSYIHGEVIEEFNKFLIEHRVEIQKLKDKHGIKD